MDDYDEDDLLDELDGLNDELDDLDMAEDEVPSYMVSANANLPDGKQSPQSPINREKKPDNASSSIDVCDSRLHSDMAYTARLFSANSFVVSGR